MNDAICQTTDCEVHKTKNLRAASASWVQKTFWEIQKIFSGNKNFRLTKSKNITNDKKSKVNEKIKEKKKNKKKQNMLLFFDFVIFLLKIF